MRPEGEGFETGGLEDGDGRELLERAETEEISWGKRWVLGLRRREPDWPTATRLTLELSRGVSVCELSILQQGFQHLPLSDCLTIWELYRKRWRRAAERLTEALRPGPEA
jgi:hypothetical protein